MSHPPIEARAGRPLFRVQEAVEWPHFRAETLKHAPLVPRERRRRRTRLMRRALGTVAVVGLMTAAALAASWFARMR